MASTYLTRTGGTATDGKKFTYSVWFKRGNLGSNKELFCIYLDNTNRLFLRNNGDDFEFQVQSKSFSISGNRQFRDTSAWYHFVVTADSTEATDSDRIKWYVNGERQTITAGSSYPSLNNVFPHGQGNANYYVGNGEYNSSPYTIYWDGSMSHVHFIDGTAYDASAFGQADANGVWTIKTSPSVTYGTNGFFILKDGNSVTDQSPNTNNFTVAGGTLTNTEDCPSNVFATFNPLITVWSGVTTLSNGNTTVTNSDATDGSPPTTIGATSGKYYWEMKQENANDVFIGVCGDGFVSDDLANSYSGITSNATTGLLVYNSSGDKVVNGSTSSSFFTSYGSGNIIGIALDLDSATKTVTFYKNGVVDSQGPQNLPTNMQSGAVFGVAIVDDSATVSANFGNGYFGTTAVASAGTNVSGIGIFEHDVPTGYTALSTKGLNL
jgi:hypothetical protein